jgi:hypothetical protein
MSTFRKCVLAPNGDGGFEILTLTDVLGPTDTLLWDHYYNQTDTILGENSSFMRFYNPQEKTTKIDKCPTQSDMNTNDSNNCNISSQTPLNAKCIPNLVYDVENFQSLLLDNVRYEELMWLIYALANLPISTASAWQNHIITRYPSLQVAFSTSDRAFMCHSISKSWLLTNEFDPNITNPPCILRYKNIDCLKQNSIELGFNDFFEKPIHSVMSFYKRVAVAMFKCFGDVAIGEGPTRDNSHILATIWPTLTGVSVMSDNEQKPTLSLLSFLLNLTTQCWSNISCPYTFFVRFMYIFCEHVGYEIITPDNKCMDGDISQLQYLTLSQIFSLVLTLNSRAVEITTQVGVQLNLDIKPAAFGQKWQTRWPKVVSNDEKTSNDLWSRLENSHQQLSTSVMLEKK